MNITFRQLRLFLALAETGSVSAAARAMHVTQPTASMQLKDMAQAVGVPLHELVGKKIYLTDVGRELAATARAIAAPVLQGHGVIVVEHPTRAPGGALAALGVAPFDRRSYGDTTLSLFRPAVAGAAAPTTD